MSRSLNKVMLIGNVGADPEVRTVGTGGKVASFSLATSNSWTDASGTKNEKTEWHRCVVWNAKGGSGLADVVERYVKKGEKLYVEGTVEYRQWQDKDGQTRYTTEIKVKELNLLGGRAQNGEGRASDQSANRSARPAAAKAPNAPRPTTPVPAPAMATVGGGDDFADFPGALADELDDLPF